MYFQSMPIGLFQCFLLWQAQKIAETTINHQPYQHLPSHCVLTGCFVCDHITNVSYWLYLPTILQHNCSLGTCYGLHVAKTLHTFRYLALFCGLMVMFLLNSILSIRSIQAPAHLSVNRAYLPPDGPCICIPIPVLLVTMLIVATRVTVSMSASLSSLTFVLLCVVWFCRCLTKIFTNNDLQVPDHRLSSSRLADDFRYCDKVRFSS